jgi:microcystin-dependent protein
VPANWAQCVGQLLSATSYQALFFLLGNKFGGDGQTTFAVPNLRGKEPGPSTGYFIALAGEFPQF